MHKTEESLLFKKKKKTKQLLATPLLIGMAWLGNKNRLAQWLAGWSYREFRNGCLNIQAVEVCGKKAKGMKEGDPFRVYKEKGSHIKR
jgi:hypothetical protein